MPTVPKLWTAPVTPRPAVRTATPVVGVPAARAAATSQKSGLSVRLKPASIPDPSIMTTLAFIAGNLSARLVNVPGLDCPLRDLVLEAEAANIIERPAPGQLRQYTFVVSLVTKARNEPVKLADLRGVFGPQELHTIIAGPLLAPMLKRNGLEFTGFLQHDEGVSFLVKVSAQK